MVSGVYCIPCVVVLVVIMILMRLGCGHGDLSFDDRLIDWRLHNSPEHQAMQNNVQRYLVLADRDETYLKKC